MPWNLIWHSRKQWKLRRNQKHVVTEQLLCDQKDSKEKSKINCHTECKKNGVKVTVLELPSWGESEAQVLVSRPTQVPPSSGRSRGWNDLPGNLLRLVSCPGLLTTRILPSPEELLLLWRANQLSSLTPGRPWENFKEVQHLLQVLCS